MIKFTYQQTINILIALGLTTILSAFKINAYILYLSCIAFYIIIYIITLRNDRKRVRGQNITKESYIDLIDECNEKDIKIAKLENKLNNKVNVPYKYAMKQDLPFVTIPPYIGQEVTVRYGGQIVTAPITNILGKEKGVRYKVKGTGRREYKIDEMELG